MIHVHVYVISIVQSDFVLEVWVSIFYLCISLILL